MKKSVLFISIIVFFLASSEVSSQTPKYASEETRQIVEKMIAAHGGMETWKKAKTMSFDNIFFSEFLGKEKFWINKVTVDQQTKRVYQEWSLHNATMAFDGKQTWSVNWKVGNPPKFEAMFYYYFLNLPWLTQYKNVELGAVEKIKHKAFENEVYVIQMSFAESPVVGKTALDSYKLFIDSKDFWLIGYEYTIGYGGLLDAMGMPTDRQVFGPNLRINDSFIKVDGLIYPRLMHTSNLEVTKNLGFHAIVNYSLKATFDETKLTMPKDAVVDKSNEKRAAKK
jgi:hypothetical protein